MAGRERPEVRDLNAFNAVKAGVAVEDYARTLTELRPSGLRLVGRCPIPGHDDRTPSFNIWPEAGTWWCFGCSRGSDVIDLCQAIEGGEPWEAMMTLATRYDIRLPEKPKRWLEWADEKGRRRRMLAETVAASYRRRLFRFFKEDFESITDPKEREEEARKFWAELWPVAWICAQRRLTGEPGE